ncbi:MAG: alpha-glucan family phosphorylase [Calditrichaeota bacterium]|nr:alpha-glucan family phosphorylase [Calditrichota bacterium]
MKKEKKVAYFTMEIALDPGMPTYSGGLGVLAGDTLRSAANLKIPMVAVTLLHRKGYFFQKLDENGNQIEEPIDWQIDDYLEELPVRALVTIENRQVHIRAWRYNVQGFADHSIPVLFLDSDLAENSEFDRTLTHYLYGGDEYYRLCQEIILGIGGVRILRALGYDEIIRFHMNEGHASLLAVELVKEYFDNEKCDTITPKIIKNIRKQCVFTTHTPVPAGHDQFPISLVEKVLNPIELKIIKELDCCDNKLNMTHLALTLSHYVNGVAKKHGEVSREMFPNYVIDSITNGVNVASWASKSMQKLFDKYIAGWREDNFSLRSALSIPNEEIWRAHRAAKEELFLHISEEMNVNFDLDVLTIGFARRAAAYKRADLIFSDLERLFHIHRNVGAIQLIFAGKAHPKDENGKQLIRQLFQAISKIEPEIRVVYLPNYDIELGRLITSGVDIWLNNPIPPLEASGTSGMKAALNGVPSLSVLDGWWIEGCIENVTGWAIGDLQAISDDQRRARDAASLYDKLERVVVPTYYNDRDKFINIMRHAIALNGSFFTTQRMMMQYVLKAYFL